ncbi:glycosyltransferase family 4 protein [Paenibacillus sp. y28]|uniref:glycosyltransferase family 4 protein n=1 Tax=Paenibacillus sp. y28 TaxID=3129110 RepID=UPI0030192692
MMKVALYNHTSVVSGAEMNLLLLCKYAAEIRPIVFAPDGDLLGRARAAGVDVQPIPDCKARLTGNPLHLLAGMLRMLRSGWSFARLVRQTDVELIHANSLRAGMMASLFQWLHRRPVVWHVQDNPPRGWIGAGIALLARAAAKALIVISEAVAGGFEGQGLASKLHLVHNGVEVNEVPSAERLRFRETVRSGLQTPASSPVLLMMGQIAPWKRQEDAVRVTARLADQGHDVYLWIVGEPKFREENHRYSDYLHQLVKELKLEDRVRFTGFREDVQEICASADLLFLCSDKEPFGRVVIEAMAQAIPVVATRDGGVPEIIEHGVSGLLYDTADLDGLYSAASSLLQYPSLRESMGKMGQLRVEERFTIHTMASQIEAVYKRVLAAEDTGTKRQPDHAAYRSDSRLPGLEKKRAEL